MKVVFCFLTMLIACSVQGQGLKLKNLSVNSGLSHSDVRSITTDENGLVWLATNSGLNRFSGYDLTVFKKDLSNPQSLPNNRTSKVISDRSGSLYMLSEKSEAFFYDIRLDEFHYIKAGSGELQEFEELFSDNNERFFLRTPQNKIFEIIGGNEVIAKKSFDLNDSLIIASSHLFDDRFYFLSDHGQVFSYSEETNKTELLKTGNEKVLGWSNANDQSILFCTKSGIFSISNNQVKQLLKQRFNEADHIVDIIEDNKGGFWVAYYSNGVSRFVNDRGITAVTHYNEENVLATNRINDLLIDDFNELWIATSGAGLYHVNLSAKPFYEINKQHGFGLPDNYVTAIYNIDNDLWVGTRKGLAKILNYERKSHHTEVILSEKHITRIFVDQSGRMLVGTRRDGLYAWEGRAFRKLDQINSEEISGIEQDYLGRLWIATFDKGIAVLDQQDQSRQSNVKYLLPNYGITFIHMDKKSPNVWLGTIDNGLIAVDITEAHSFKFDTHKHKSTDANSLSSDYTWPIAQSEDGSLWVGTIGGGLNLLDRDEHEKAVFERFTVSDGLPDNDIESLLIDDNGLIWLGGRGLSVFDPANKEIVNNFNHQDGLQSNSFKIGAAFKGADGRLFFGGINGLNYFSPEAIKPNATKARLIFDQLSILNSPIKVGQTVNGKVVLPENLNNTTHLVFEADQNEFTIDILAVHHGNPDKNGYAYMLDGYNEGWTQVLSNNRKVTFANLKHGTYIFKAKVSNGDGLWSEVKELTIEILPPWYLTWWALTGYFITLFLLLLSYRYLIIKQAHLQKDLIDSETENRKNEDRLTLFTNISHEIRTPLTLIKGPLEDLVTDEHLGSDRQADLLTINRNVDRLLRLANQLLDFRKYESGQVELCAAEGNIIKFISEVCVLFRTESDRRNIKLNFTSSSDKVLLTYDRDKLEIVLANLMVNALKFTDEGGEVNVKVQAVGDDTQPAQFKSGHLKENYLQISISDTGKGMDSQELKKVFDRFYQVASLKQLDIQGTGIGLALVNAIVLQHKGEIDVTSKRSKGSTFTVKMPFGNDHLSPNELLPNFQDSESIATFENFSGSVSDLEVSDTSNETGTKKPLVLVVEDNAEIASYIQKCLQSRYRIKQARNGQIGLKKAEELLPDLIISDVMMPQMDGIEMLKKVRENQSISFIPVVLLTARTSTLYEIQGIETGAQDYITKPFNPKVLIAKVNSILDVRKKYIKHYLKELKNEASDVELPNAEFQFLENLRKLVLDNLTNEEFSVTKLTKMVGMSQSAFYKRVKELTGRSAVQFLRDVRLKKASELIRKGDLSISQVAYSVGINDQKYFREKFKDLFGVNPSVYKDEVSGENVS